MNGREAEIKEIGKKVDQILKLLHELVQSPAIGPSVPPPPPASGPSGSSYGK